jgi:NaMN:DMB phosphoribosyltransferase
MERVILRPKQTFAIEKAAANDQCRRLFEEGRNVGERLDDSGLGCIRR